MNMSLNEQMNFHYYHKMTAKKEKKGEGPQTEKERKESMRVGFYYSNIHHYISSTAIKRHG